MRLDKFRHESAKTICKDLPSLAERSPGAMAKLYTRDMRKWEILRNFILSQRAGKTYYLCMIVKQQHISVAEQRLKEKWKANGDRIEGLRMGT